MDSIYFQDPLGLLIELASYRFEPPAGHTHADVLLEAHRLRVERGDYHIEPSPRRRRDRGARRALAGVAVGRPLAEGGLPVTILDRDALRALQAPLKERYKDDPDAARVTLSATGTLDDELACNVQTGRALAKAGLHPATGGDGSLLCSGDMLLEALVACAGVTLKAVATALEIEVAAAHDQRGGRPRLPRDARRGPRRAGRVRRHPPALRARRARRRRRSARDAAEAHRALLRGPADAAQRPAGDGDAGASRPRAGRRRRRARRCSSSTSAGSSCSGRMECTACATAIADSAKPVAMSLSLPSKVVMSPHAHTRSSDVFMT